MAVIRETAVRHEATAASLRQALYYLRRARREQAELEWAAVLREIVDDVERVEARLRDYAEMHRQPLPRVRVAE